MLFSYCGPAYSNELRERINHLGTIGSGYLRLFESEKRNHKGSNYTLLDASAILLIQGTFSEDLELEHKCKLTVKFGERTKTIRVTHQECSEVLM